MHFLAVAVWRTAYLVRHLAADMTNYPVRNLPK
jgi:hypothetical protein